MEDTNTRGLRDRLSQSWGGSRTQRWSIGRLCRYDEIIYPSAPVMVSITAFFPQRGRNFLPNAQCSFY